MADRDVAGLVGRGREADPDQLGDDAVDAVGLGIDRDIALVPSPRRSSGRAPPRSSPSHIACGRRRSSPSRPAARQAPGFDAMTSIGRAPPLDAPPPPTRLSSDLNPWSSRNALQRLGRNALQRQILERLGQRRCRRPAAPARATGARMSACSIRFCLSLGLVISSVERQHRLQVAILLDQLARGLGADAGHARAHCRRCRPSAPARRRPSPAATPNFSITWSRPMRRSFIVSSMSTLPSSISCIRSLSELTIVTFHPASDRGVRSRR